MHTPTIIAGIVCLLVGFLIGWMERKTPPVPSPQGIAVTPVFPDCPDHPMSVFVVNNTGHPQKIHSIFFRVKLSNGAVRVASWKEHELQFSPRPGILPAFSSFQSYFLTTHSAITSYGVKAIQIVVDSSKGEFCTPWIGDIPKIREMTEYVVRDDYAQVVTDPNC